MIIVYWFIIKNKLFEWDNVFLSPHIAGNFSKYSINVISAFTDSLNQYLNNKSLKIEF